MKIESVDIYRYRVPFREPISVRGVPLEHREGLVLALRAQGCTSAAYGEVAPLPGLHDESVGMAAEELAASIPRMVKACSKGGESLDGFLRQHGRFPSVQTGLEMALLNLDAVTSSTRPSFPGSFPACNPVPLNALLFGRSDSVLELAGTCYMEGYRTFKLKVKAGETDLAIATIRALHKEFGGRIELRLDANQTLTLQEAVSFAKSLPARSVSFIEEPLRDPSGIGEFHAATAIPSALDESLWQQPTLLEELPPESIGALVLKPNRLGGIQRSLELSRIALQRNIPAILSSAFESGISLGLYAWLAALIAPAPTACGLDTCRYLESDLLQHPFTAKNGVIAPETAWMNSREVNLNLLTPLSSWTL